MASATVDHLAELLAKLRVETNRKYLLRQVTAILSSVNTQEIEEISERLQLTPLFDCLNADSKEIEIACAALNQLLSSLPPSVLLHQYQNELMRGLEHPDVEVKKLVLKQLSRCVEDGTELSLVRIGGLLVMVANLLAHSDMTIMKYAHQVLVNVTKQQTAGLSMLFSTSVLSSLGQVMVQNDIKRFRVYNVIIDVSKQSEMAIHKCIESGLLAQLIAEINTDDVLIQLNCLEMIAELTMTTHGLQYLEDNGVVKKLENMLQQAQSATLMKLLLPGLFKFFGYVGHFHPKEICTRYRGFVNMLFQAVDHEDLVLQGVAIQTLGILGSSVDGKFALDKFGEPTIKCIRSLGSAIVRGVSDQKIKALSALECLLNVQESEQTTETNDLVKKWFDQLTSRSMEDLWSVCRQPFADLRCASLKIFHVIARQYWGQQYMNDLPGFVEYLLDRSTETDKDGKEAKYEVIKTLADSPTSCETLGNIVVSCFQRYVEEGPFYVRAEAAIVFEETN